MIPALGGIQLAKLGPRDVERMTAALRADGMAPRSLQHCRGILRNALNDARRWGYVTTNAAALARPPKVSEREAAAIGPEEARRIL